MASVALDATGGKFEVVPVASPVASAQRVVLFDGLDVDGDEWLLHTVAEALDEAEASALVTAGAVGDGEPLAALEAARAAHIAMYALRQPVRTRPTAWRPEQARVVTNAVLDGAMVEHGGASWWDVSSAVVLDVILFDCLTIFGGQNFFSDIGGGGSSGVGASAAAPPRGGNLGRRRVAVGAQGDGIHEVGCTLAR